MLGNVRLYVIYVNQPWVSDDAITYVYEKNCGPPTYAPLWLTVMSVPTFIREAASAAQMSCIAALRWSPVTGAAGSGQSSYSVLVLPEVSSYKSNSS